MNFNNVPWVYSRFLLFGSARQQINTFFIICVVRFSSAFILIMPEITNCALQFIKETFLVSCLVSTLPILLVYQNSFIFIFLLLLFFLIVFTVFLQLSSCTSRVAHNYEMILFNLEIILLHYYANQPVTNRLICYFGCFK